MAGKKLRMFEPLFVCCAFKSKFSLRSFTAMPTLMFVHVHLYTLNVGLIMWACSSKVEALGFVAVSFLSPALRNPSRNSNRNKTSTRYKAIIQFWRLSIVNQGKSNIDKTLLKTRANLRSLRKRSFEFDIDYSSQP